MNHTSTDISILDAFQPSDLLTAYISLLVGALIFLSIEIRIEVPKPESITSAADIFKVRSKQKRALGVLGILTRYRRLEISLTAVLIVILIIPIILIIGYPQNPILSVMVFNIGLMFIAVRTIFHLIAQRLAIVIEPSGQQEDNDR